MKNLNGKVSLDINSYNELLEKAQKLDRLFTMEANYPPDVDVKVNLSVVGDELRAMLKEQYPEATFQESLLTTNWNTPSSRIGTLPVQDD